jgi:hypothetical protein
MPRLGKVGFRPTDASGRAIRSARGSTRALFSGLLGQLLIRILAFLRMNESEQSVRFVNYPSSEIQLVLEKEECP